jgi:hypothetical protein
MNEEKYTDCEMNEEKFFFMQCDDAPKKRRTGA